MLLIVIVMGDRATKDNAITESVKWSIYCLTELQEMQK